MRGRLIVLVTLLSGCGSLPNLGTAAQEATMCPGPTVLQGIDVSYYQGNIDWQAVAAAGYKFAIARTGDGTFMDPKFDQNWRGIKEAGLIRGVYHFFRPNGDPVQQANLMLERTGTLGPGDLPPVLDVEYTPGASLPSRGVMVQKIRAWVDRVREVTGLDPIIYAGSYFWDDAVASTEFNDLPLWLPAYSPLCPRLPAAWSSWTFHQYSSEGRVPGITGNVDLNKFNGTQDELNQLAGIGACAPHCEGSVLVDASCGRGNCGTFGATCVDDALGVRCISVFCPPRGTKSVCLTDETIATCEEGAITSSGNCAAFGAWCSTAGTDSARCVSVFCVSGPNEVPAAQNVCLPDGSLGRCSSAGTLESLGTCAQGQHCVSDEAGARCATKPDGGSSDGGHPSPPDAGAADGGTTLDAGTTGPPTADAGYNSSADAGIAFDGGTSGPGSAGGCSATATSAVALQSLLFMLLFLALVRRRGSPE